MTTDLNPEAIWRALPDELKSALSQRAAEPLNDELLIKCHRAAEENDLPIFWRPDPAADFGQHRLHPALVEYITR
ncbi:hypothetical protein [Mycobacteroides franklinii]|uniref:Uncharacterized protein n=1 Tax=Mycobacteroides franklinii TaxID=948102 RepID=A0A4R8R464_9MYCO|nr:hypothetical protein [Mycobacteroides franklinii]TDZ43619.1 hypothetical protein CCUG64054_03677 [Mycobacteroides franklinii]TDZ50754.1 hypothetical protein CCUG63697_02263 [Mycobacteroides franklinii]TDZ57174.1 hypothetical protein CCUG63696_03679 [Mycobacteroides franklinii]TDZ64115.1 hypothetical protein CCUG63695_03604 [Mycobacteroides franklinii]TDZ70512.1 hypothetical protein CCUG64056_03677 [Mycobacteroides franklinii]